MSKRTNSFLVDDILQSINRIFTYTEGISEREFLNNFLIQDAVSRNFEIIGEASSRLSKKFKEYHNAIDWNKVKDFRNKLIHDYFGTDYGVVWLIIINNIPDLQKNLESIQKFFDDHTL
jgi:uncharacterized protein with HEPN domain